jgi:Inosine-uridine preferring nucleoside hydrolase
MNGIRARAGVVSALVLGLVMLPGLASCGSGAPPGRAAATPVIVDTDMSSDDIMALTYLLERTDVSVRAITVEGTGVADGRPGAQNVRRLIRALGIRRPRGTLRTGLTASSDMSAASSNPTSVKAPSSPASVKAYQVGLWITAVVLVRMLAVYGDGLALKPHRRRGAERRIPLCR